MLNTHAIYIEKLSPEYKKVFGQIRSYVLADNADEIRNEEILSEVLDSFLMAQEAGKTPEQTIGNDLEGYCKGLCSEVGIKSRLLHFVEQLRPLFVCYLFLCIIDIIDLWGKISDGESIALFKYRGGFNIVAFLIGGIIFYLSGAVTDLFTKKLLFSKPEKYRKISFAVRTVVIVLIVGAIIYFFRGKECEGTYLWISLAVTLAFLAAERIISRKSRRYRKENRISLADLAGVSGNVYSDLEKTEMKRYERFVRKSERKGLGKPDFRKFLESEKRSCLRWDKKPVFYGALAVGSTVIGFIFTLLCGGFEGVSDGFVFAGVLLAVESFLMYGIFRLVDTGTKARLNWINSKEAE
ncbi:DUF1048 domain-containing protein [Ruminococcus sp.]|uniref:DUF1048 domain-containing protein n=1 Tax=Ruminococcus sp. TaxID=41978 RepID=UPI0025FBDB8F|nr:DUF1048 domain-containing protein [Ruminococcus sp.]MBQ8965186.1 DUF1048 domain-containing protein [Ruminococcus sp.]